MELSSATAGFGLGASLILAIGAQNAYVLRQGLRREHVLTVVGICAASDALLIALGIAGMGALVTSLPGLMTAIRWVGAAFLTGYGLLALRRAVRPDALVADDAAHGSAWAAVAGTTVALTWLNPHVYLDTVVLLGSVARSHGDPFAFGVGAACASLVWFTGLGFGARLLRPLFARPAAWRVLDVVVAAVMLTLAVGLLV
ncbi:LysE/ArgO family amino acid transporter [Spongisporangium articulatum]|uniref:LysE/ArgO family amino acid transporter n=1 Tax=Spongisporangium articulatum TaxID=3362603 RepID=A0ABW8AIG0_9ACTN